MSLDKALRAYDGSITKNTPELPGELGITLGGSRVVEVPNRGEFVYVRLRSNQSEVIQAFNDKVFPAYNLPVLVKWKNNRYEVTGRDTQRYPKWEADNPHLARHGDTHILNKEGGKIGSDPVWVYPYQMMPALVAPFPVNNARNVYINPYPLNDNGDWKYFGNTGTENLLPYKPISGSVLILVTIDSTSGNPALFATTGTYIPSPITGTVQLIEYLPTINQNRYIPLSYVQIHSGTSNIGWEEIYDIRQWISVRSTGTGGSGGVTIKKDGNTLGSTSTLDFVGANVIPNSNGIVGTVKVHDLESKQRSWMF